MGCGWGGGGWMASLTRWTWVWLSSRSWWWSGKPGVLLSTGSQRVRHWRTVIQFLWGSFPHCICPGKGDYLPHPPSRTRTQEWRADECPWVGQLSYAAYVICSSGREELALLQTHWLEVVDSSLTAIWRAWEWRPGQGSLLFCHTELN